MDVSHGITDSDGITIACNPLPGRVQPVNKMLDVHSMNKLAMLSSGVSMLDTAHDDKPEDSRILLGILSSVERDGGQSQRRLGSELGIALGLVNAYLKRCVKKGLIKVTDAPARRYFYYLTPQGFAEKSRLTVEYLSSSFAFFRQAKADCDAALKAGAERNFTRIALAGISDLAEVAMICAPENGVKIVAVVDGTSQRSQFVGVPVVSSFEAIVGTFDAVLITDMRETARTLERVVAQVGSERALLPTLLNLRTRAANDLGTASEVPS
jgi:DNA-binding MarR family transcriptional regulator